MCKKQGKNCFSGRKTGLRAKIKAKIGFWSKKNRVKSKKQGKNCTARLSGILGRSFCEVFCQVVEAEGWRHC